MASKLRRISSGSGAPPEMQTLTEARSARVTPASIKAFSSVGTT